jgi:putative acetyltransferase
VTIGAVRLRRARPDDAVRIRNLHVRSIRTLCAPDYTRREIAAWADRRPARGYRWAMTKGGETMFVAMANERIVGFSCARPGEIAAVYVDPRHVRQGVGRRLLAVAEGIAGRASRTLRLDASLTAVPFYLASGYRQERRHSVLRGGVPIPCVRMTKRLRAGKDRPEGTGRTGAE